MTDQTSAALPAAPELNAAAWDMLQRHATRVDGEHTPFEGDWGNWNYLWSELWRLHQRAAVDSAPGF